MFQTEINLWLQGHGGWFLTNLFYWVSELGHANVYLALLVVITFGLDLRRGWLLGQVLLWTAGLTEFAKQSLALPRPIHVDSRVLYPPTGRPEQEIFNARGGSSFLGGLPRDVIDYYRARGDLEWGLPSGHTAVATACWGSVAVLLRLRSWWLVTALTAGVMGLSRLYLGRHFLADVLAGAILGALVVVGLRLLLRERAGAVSWMAAGAAQLAEWLQSAVFVAFAFAAPVLLLPFAWKTGDLWAAQLWGWNLAFWVLVRRRRPYGGGSAGQRVLRVAIGFASALCAVAGAAALGKALGWDRSPWGLLVESGLAVLILTLAGVALCERLGLYPASDASGRPVEETGRPDLSA